MKRYNFKAFAIEAMNERGFTHILCADGKLISIKDIAENKVTPPRAPRGCFWASNGANIYPNITLFSKYNGNLGFYRLVKKG